MVARRSQGRGISVALAAILVASSHDLTRPPIVAAAPGPVAPITAVDGARSGVELVDRRTATSDTFDNGDGTFTTTLYAEPVYYEPPGRTGFEPIDVAFRAKGANDTATISDRAPAQVLVAPATDPRGFLSVTIGGHTIRFAGPAPEFLSPIASAEPLVTGATADLAEVLPGVGLRVLARPDGAHTFFVLDSPADAANLVFAIYAPGLTLKPDGGGAYAFRDAAGAVVARLPAAYALDSTPNGSGSGSGQLTTGVSLAVTGLGSPYLATVSVEPKWLADAVYPVYVDPSITLSSTAQVGDAHVSSAYPTANFGNYCRPDPPYYCELWLGLDPGGLSGEDRDYLTFDTSPVANTTIDSATLKLFPYHQYYNAPTQITTWIDRPTTSWTENAITWNTKPATHTAIGSFTTVEGQTASYGLTSTVQGWASGTITNNGLRLWCNGCGVTAWKRLISSEQGGTNVPKLEITYHTPAATIVEPTSWTADKTLTWSYADSSGHAQSHYHVDVATSSAFTTIIGTSGDAAGAATTWTTTASLTTGSTYWWRVKVKDGTSWSPFATTSFLWDPTLPAIGAFSQPSANPTFAGSATSSWTVAWPQVTAPSAITTLTLFEDVGTIVTAGTCSGVSYAASTSWAITPTSATSKSVTAAGHTSGRCYRYYLKATSGSGGQATGPFSNPVLYDTVAPSAAFTAPPAGTTVTAIPPVAAWTESDAAAGILTRSLQRQRASISSPGVCSGTWSNDGSATTTPSPAPQTTLVGWCYRWQLTVTDRAGNAAAAITSGVLIRDPATNLGQQRQHALESWDLGSGDSLAVNAPTGNLVIDHPIVALPIRGGSTSLELAYNGQDSASVGLGVGWRLNVFRRLTLNADATVTYVDADGARYTFTNPVVNGSVTTYTRPAALYATLVKDTSLAFEFTLTYRDLGRDKFDILGSEAILVRAEDRFANGVSLTYVAGTNRISQVQDTAGARNIDFSWDASSRLATITDWAWISGGVVQTGATGARRTYRFFYDASSRLIGWSDPLNTAGSCPTGGSHLTCIAYLTNELDVAKTQTVEAAGASSLTTSTRTITTKVTFAGSDVATVTDAQQVADAGAGTTFAWSSPTLVVVTRPTTTTGYDLVAQNDAYARAQSVVRVDAEDGVEIERRTSWNATYATEPASVTDNYGALLSTPARTTSYTYVASSLGLLQKVTEPLTATTNRWTEYVYNANNDVTSKTVSLDGSPTARTVTRSCYTTQSLTCPTSETGLTLVRRIDTWVSGGPQNADVNVATDYAYDAYGQRTLETRHDRDAAGGVRDDRKTAFTYDGLGDLTAEIANDVDGVVTAGTTDTSPGSDSVRTDLTTAYTYDTAGNRVSAADPRRAIGLAIPPTTSVTFYPSDDAHVGDASPTTNYGTDPTLQASATGGPGGAYEPYLKFTVSGIVGTVTNATLRLQNIAAAGGAPSQRVTGATATGTGAITVVPASGHVAGDVELLFVETANEAATLTTAAGFAQVPGTGLGIGVAGGTDGARMTVFWRRWNGTDGSPVVADSGNHQTGFITTYGGVTSTGNPWDVVGSNQQTPSTSAGSASGVTTATANTLVVVATAGAQPDATSSAEFAGWTNAGLASLTERHDEAVTSGNGGSLGLADGVKAAAGASGTTTFTSVTSTTKDHVVIALKGEAGGGGGGAPSQRVSGATATGTGAITVVPASGHVAGDVELLFVETANEAATLTTAAGFAQVPGTGLGIGVAGGTDGARMTVFWRRWNGTDGSPVVADSGNHQTGFITTYGGVTSTGNPWDVVGSNQQTPSTSAGSASGVTTATANTLVVVATAGAQPDATSSAEFAGWTNAGLTSLTERHDEAVTSGNGGSLGLADGIAAVAGASGTTTFSSVTATTKDDVVIALRGTDIVCAHRVADTTWAETAITWNTRPAPDPASLACVVASQPPGAVDFDLGPSVTGPGVWAFRLAAGSTSVVSYASGEHPTLDDPQLILTLSYGPLGGDDSVTRWTSDALNARLTETTPTTYGVSVAQKSSSSTYDELGNVREAIDFGGVATGTEYDRAGRVTRTFEDTDGAGSAVPATTSISTYDADGRLLTAQDRAQVASGTSSATNHGYDSLGREKFVKAAANTADESVTGFLYDALDRQTVLVVGAVLDQDGDPIAGQDTLSTYDLGGRTLSTDDGFACSTSSYDYRDLALTVRDGLAGGTCAAAANTRTVTTSYDGLGRAYRAEVTEGTGLGDRTRDDTLDSAGNRLTSAVRKSGVTSTTTFTVNLLDATIAESRPDTSTAKTAFDPAGNAADRCYWAPGLAVGACQLVGTPGWPNPPSQSTSSSYDARNSRIQQIDGLTNQTTSYDPDHNYAPAASYLPTGSGRELQSLFGYDTRHRLVSVSHQSCLLADVSLHTCSGGPSVLGSDTYAYDENDNRTRVVEANGATAIDRYYCYETKDQLVTVRSASGCTAGLLESYTYDPAGNRLTAPGRTFTYSADGQLTSCTGPVCTIGYDTAGRTASWTEGSVTWSYLYDSEGRLVSACKASSCSGSIDRLDLSYDGEGHRTQLTETSAAGAVTTRDFRYQGDAIVEEKLTDAGHPAGAVVRSYVVDDAGAPVKVCTPDCATATYLPTWSGHGDLLGLWRQNADGTLTLANSVTYDTWGRPTLGVHNGYADLGVRLLYVGRSDVWWDDAFGAGLLYMHARHYSPTLGRFLQPDPADDEQNLYRYAGNSPVTRQDPSGEWWCLAGLLAGGVGVVLSCAAEAITIVVVAGALVYFSARTGAYVGEMIKDNRRADTVAVQVTPQDAYLLSKKGGQKPQDKIRNLQNARRGILEKIRNAPRAPSRNHWERQLKGLDSQIERLTKRWRG